MADNIDNVAVYDYIVIGGGTSGSVAARRLAETEHHYSVCLLEAGPRFVFFCIILFLCSNNIFLVVVMKMSKIVKCLVVWELLTGPDLVGVTK